MDSKKKKRRATLWKLEDLENLRIPDLKEYLSSRDELLDEENQFVSLLKKRLIFIPGLVLLRLFLVGESIYFLYFYICLLNDYFILFSLILTFLIIFETMFLLLCHDGRDFYWISVSTASFVIFSIILLWSAVKRITNMIGANPCSPNFSSSIVDVGDINISSTNSNLVDDLNKLLSDIKKCSGISYFSADFCEFFYFLVVMYLILLMINKMATPFSRKLKAKEHTTFAATLLSLSADIFDYLSNMAIVDLVGFDAIFGK